MSPAERWLRERTEGAPEGLVREMIAGLPAPGPTVADTLAAGALALYRRVAAGNGGREDALPLLAADALLTHAFQAQAEGEPAGLAAAAERWGGGGLLGEVADEL